MPWAAANDTPRTHFLHFSKNTLSRHGRVAFLRDRNAGQRMV